MTTHINFPTALGALEPLRRPHAHVTFANHRETDVELTTTTCNVRLNIPHGLTERQLLDSLHAQVTKALAIAAMDEESAQREQERYAKGGLVDKYTAAQAAQNMGISAAQNMGISAIMGHTYLRPTFDASALKITEE